MSPCLEQPSGQAAGSDQTADISAGLKDLTNRFAMLEVEEPPEFDSLVMQEVPKSAATTKSSSSKKQATIEMYELEDNESTDDLTFGIFCTISISFVLMQANQSKASSKTSTVSRIMLVGFGLDIRMMK